MLYKITTRQSILVPIWFCFGSIIFMTRPDLLRHCRQKDPTSSRNLLLWAFVTLSVTRITKVPTNVRNVVNEYNLFRATWNIASAFGHATMYMFRHAHFILPNIYLPEIRTRLCTQTTTIQKTLKFTHYSWIIAEPVHYVYVSCSWAS